MKKNIWQYTRCYVPSAGKTLEGKDLTPEQIEELIPCALKNVNYRTLNHRFLDNDYQWINPIIMEVLKDVNSFLNSYNYDNSDITIDYFNTNFYTKLSIGKHDKPAKFVERTARISPTKQTKAKRLTA